MVAVYERSTGTAITQAEGFCRHLTTGGTFDTVSQPTRAWVTSQLDLDAAYIATRLESCGYAATQTDEDVLQLLEAWNTVRTVIAIELSNPVESISGKGNERFQEFRSRSKMLEELACSAGLADLGATVSGGLGEFLVAGGVSRSRKQTVEEDTDHIKHRIRRGQFKYPSTSQPAAETDYESET